MGSVWLKVSNLSWVCSSCAERIINMVKSAINCTKINQDSAVCCCLHPVELFSFSKTRYRSASIRCNCFVSQKCDSIWHSRACCSRSSSIKVRPSKLVHQSSSIKALPSVVVSVQVDCHLFETDVFVIIRVHPLRNRKHEAIETMHRLWVICWWTRVTDHLMWWRAQKYANAIKYRRSREIATI